MNSKDQLALLTEDQRSTLNQFRDAIQDILQPHHDDYFLLRWLRARDFDIRKSEKMIRKSLKFRAKFKVDELTTGNYIVPEVYRKYGITADLGFDNEGCFIRYVMPGFCDVKGFMHSLRVPEIVKLILHVLESDLKSITENNSRAGLHETRNVYIADCREFSLRQIYSRQVIDVGIELVKLYLDNYPETLKVVYLVNVPYYAYWIWNIFKPLLDPVTLSKVKLFPTGNQSWKDQLIEIADPEIIPAFLGGSRCDPDGNPTCQTLVKWTHEKIPDSYFYKDQDFTPEADSDVRIAVVRERSHFEHTVPIEKPGSTLKWEFQTKNCNINFGIFYKQMEWSRIPSGSPDELIPVENVECHFIPETGELLCEKAGQYILHFDNKHSWLTSKCVLYKVTVVEPEEDDAEEK